MKKILLVILPALLGWNITKAQTALDFNGSNNAATHQRVNIGSIPALTNFTVEFDITHNGSDATYDRFVSNTNNGFNLAVANDGRVRIWSSNLGITTWPLFGYTMPLNTWQHMSVVYDGINIALYVNGAFVNQLSTNGSSILAANWGIAANEVGYTENANVKVDNFRLWNDARTSEEIASNYQTCLTGYEPNLIVLYDFEEGAGSIVNDLAGGDNNGIIINSAAWVAGVNCTPACTDPTDPTVPTITASVNPVCAGSTTTLSISGSLNDATQWDVYTGSCGGTLLGTTTGSTFVVTPTGPSTTYYIRGEGGCTPGSCGSVTIMVNTSTAPTISPIGTVCPNTDVVLSASGGVVEPGSVIKWYSGPNGTGSSLGTGSSINVLPTATNTTYYVRREGVCITSDASITVNVKEYIYAPTGSTSNTYCTDNNGWHHFYNSNDKIILSVQGDLTGAPAGYPIITINENTNFYQENESLTSTPADCSSGYSPQEQRFEMKRNWNVDFGGGTTNGTYNVRFYHKPEEKSYIEIAAINFMATYPSCGYSYKYNAGNLGFYWFKNSGTNYIAPQFDGIYHIAAGIGTISGINYAELQGITSFSGGSGAIILVPDASLLGTEDFENISKFSIYPNPTSGLLNINTSFDGNFIIINQLGQIVHSFKATSNIENIINVENLSDGVYYVKGINGTKVNSQKLIIRK